MYTATDNILIFSFLKDDQKKSSLHKQKAIKAHTGEKTRFGRGLRFHSIEARRYQSNIYKSYKEKQVPLAKAMPSPVFAPVLGSQVDIMNSARTQIIYHLGLLPEQGCHSDLSSKTMKDGSECLRTQD